MIRLILWIISIPIIAFIKLLSGPIPGQKRYRRKRNKWGGYR